MNDDTLLLRQIHPAFLQGNRPSSQAFKPTPKDQQKISAYDGDRIKPIDAYRHYTNDLGYNSQGVLAVTLSECVNLGLNAYSDPDPFPEHVLVDFSPYNRSETEKRAKKLRDKALTRGWQYLEGT